MPTKKTAQPAPSTPEDVEPATSELMAAEANPPAKPKGSPAVVPFAALPRRAKAAFFTHFQKVMERGPLLDELTTDTEVDAGDAALLYEVLADIEDALTVIAVDTDAMEAWLTQAGDAQLLELVFWYADRFQVGEAKASST